MLLFFIFQMEATAQQKFERESRLKQEDVPPAALQFIDAVELETNWKWYFEENLVGNSVEAKTKHNGKWYSVEFDTSGKIQDVEVESDWNGLDEKVRVNISEALDSLFIRSEIDKIQIQYVAEKQNLIGLLNSEPGGPGMNIQYEIVVKGKKTGRPKLYELTFSDSGALKAISEIVFRNTDNLEF